MDGGFHVMGMAAPLIAGDRSRAVGRVVPCRTCDRPSALRLRWPCLGAAPRAARPSPAPRPGAGPPPAAVARAGPVPRRRPRRVRPAAGPPPPPAPPPPTDTGCDPHEAGEIRIRAENLGRRAGPLPLPWASWTCRRATSRIQADAARHVRDDEARTARSTQRIVAAGQRGVHARRGAAGRATRWRWTSAPATGMFENAHGLRRAGRVRGGGEDRARRRRHLPDRGRDASPPAPSPARAGASPPRPRPGGGRQDRGQNVVFRVKQRARLLHARTSSTRSRRTSAPPASCSRTSASPTLRGFNMGTGSSGPWAAASTRPSTSTTTRSTATASATSSATRWPRPPAATSAPTSSTASDGGGWELRLQLGRAADAAGQGAGHPAACRQYERPRVPGAVPGQPRPGLAAATARASVTLQRSFGRINVQAAGRPHRHLLRRATTSFDRRATCPSLRRQPGPAQARAHRRSCSATRPRGEQPGLRQPGPRGPRTRATTSTRGSRGRCRSRSCRSRRRCRGATRATAATARPRTASPARPIDRALPRGAAWTCAGPPSRASSTRRGTSTPSTTST